MNTLKTMMKAMSKARKQLILFAAGLIAAVGLTALASGVTLPNTFSNGTVADATQVNANFQAVQTAVNDNNSRITSLEGITIGGGISGSSLQTLASGANYIYVNVPLSPSRNLLCQVTATLDDRSGPNTDTTSTLKVAVKTDGIDGSIVWDGTALPDGPTHPTATDIEVIHLTAGSTYYFGCLVYAWGDFAGDSVYCKATWVCR